MFKDFGKKVQPCNTTCLLSTTREYQVDVGLSIYHHLTVGVKSRLKFMVDWRSRGGKYVEREINWHGIPMSHIFSL